MKTYRLAPAALCMLLAGTALQAQVPDWAQRTTISGLAFGDIYAMVANHDSSLEGANGIWARRIYFTVDNRLSDAYAFRLRLEMNSPGDFGTAGRLQPYVKDLYLRWTRGGHQAYVGISATPTWETVEKVWGYRDVEKTPLDFLRLGTSRDFGLAARGRLDPGGRLRYHAMIGNGADVNAETNSNKKSYLALSLHPGSGLVMELYGDYDSRPGEQDRTTVQAFAGYEAQRGRFGVQWARQRREIQGAPTLNLEVLSGFAVLQATPRLAFLGRVDRTFDPNPDGRSIPYLPLATSARSTLFLAGADVVLSPRVHLIPNLVTVVYDGTAAPKPGSDVMLRTTFSITF